MTGGKETNKEFERLFSDVEQLRKRYFITLATHKLFKRLNVLHVINVVGKRKAERNAKTLNEYPYFFVSVKESCRCFFLVELAKFFDPFKKHNKTRSVYFVLDFAQKNLHRLTRKHFQSFHKERKILPEVFATYKELKPSDLKKFEKRLKRNLRKIKCLKTYRDQYLAHDDIKKIKSRLPTMRELETLLRIVRDVIEFFYYKLEFASNDYRNFEEEPIRDIDRLVSDLSLVKLY